MSGEADQVLPGWQAQLLRLTVFPVAPLEPRVAATLWRRATGEEPEIDENRPREEIRRQAGPFGDGRLEIQIIPTRVDWVMTPILDQAAVAYSPMSFASLERGIAVLSEGARQWLRTDSLLLNRIAVGAVLLLPAASGSAAYQFLRGFLKSVQVDPENSSELFYQINWPRWSRVLPSMKLNRITKWNAMRVRGVNFDVAETRVRLLPAREDHYCRLECDHSTAMEREEAFDSPEAERLFQELCDFVSENAEKGEIPAKSGPL